MRVIVVWTVCCYDIGRTSGTASWNVEGPYVDCVDDEPVLFSAGSNCSIWSKMIAYFRIQSVTF